MVVYLLLTTDGSQGHTSFVMSTYVMLHLCLFSKLLVQHTSRIGTHVIAAKQKYGAQFEVSISAVQDSTSRTYGNSVVITGRLQYGLYCIVLCVQYQPVQYLCFRITTNTSKSGAGAL